MITCIPQFYQQFPDRNEYRGCFGYCVRFDGCYAAGNGYGRYASRTRECILPDGRHTVSLAIISDRRWDDHLAAVGSRIGRCHLCCFRFRVKCIVYASNFYISSFYRLEIESRPNVCRFVGINASNRNIKRDVAAVCECAIAYCRGCFGEACHGGQIVAIAECIHAHRGHACRNDNIL